MSAPRQGALGVGFVKGDLYVVKDNLEIERVPVGADGQVLIADSSVDIGVKWAEVEAAIEALVTADAIDAIYKTVDLSGGAIPNPTPTSRGTHSVLNFGPDLLRGTPWQCTMPLLYTTGKDLTANIYWVSDGTDTGDAILGVALERDNAGFVIDSDGFAALKVFGASAGPGVAGEIVKASAVLTGAELDGILPGDPFRLFAQRDGADIGDDLTDTLQILRVTLEEVF